MLTFRCILAVLGGTMLAGIPLAWLLKGCKPLEERDWLLAPFLAASVIVLVLSNAVLLGCRIPLTFGSSVQNPPTPRSVQHMTLYKDWLDAEHVLAALKNGNVVIACGPGVFHNGWATCAARRNNVWLVNPVLMDGSVITPNPPDHMDRPICDGICYDVPSNTVHFIKVKQLIDLTTVPAEALVMTGTLAGCQLRIEGDQRLLWHNDHFQLWRVGPGPFELCPTETARPRK